MTNTKSTLIWDLPTRIFHCLFAGGFFAAVFFAIVLGDDSPLFPYHALFGLTISIMVIMRIFWGFIGSRYARFSSFIFGPRALIEYIKSSLNKNGIRYVGHNPGAAWAAFTMLTLILGLAITGILMGQGNKNVKELHEFFAYTMLAVVVINILGVVVHTFKHRENLAASMIHGRKSVDTQASTVSSHPLVALIFCLICAAWGFGLFANYDPVKQTTVLPLVGISIQLGEGEEWEHHGESKTHHDEDD